MSQLVLEHVKKIYQSTSTQKTTALKDVSFSVEKGEYVAIMGESGSGKTTLLNLIATLDNATSGTIKLDGQEIGYMNDKESAQYRRDHLGFIFQDFNLLNVFDNKDNILLPLVLTKKNINDYQKQLTQITSELKIEKLLKKYPYQLSGGQQQRVAAARALITAPDIILADEPTGALDSVTSDKMLSLFQAINNKGQTIIMVTHSAIAASHAKRVLFIKDGSIFDQLFRGEKDNESFYSTIMSALSVL